jgi:hypothetical protein
MTGALRRADFTFGRDVTDGHGSEGQSHLDANQKGTRFGKGALLILALLLYGRLVFALVFVNQRSRRVNLFSAPGAVVILRRQILAGCGGVAVPEFGLDGGKISMDTVLKRSPSFSHRVENPFPAHRSFGARHTFALVGTRALPAIETSPQRYVLNNSQQMGIGISTTIGEYQSVSRMPQMPSRQSFGQFVIDADVELFAILHLPA